MFDSVPENARYDRFANFPELEVHLLRKKMHSGYSEISLLNLWVMLSLSFCTWKLMLSRSWNTPCAVRAKKKINNLRNTGPFSRHRKILSPIFLGSVRIDENWPKRYNVDFIIKIVFTLLFLLCKIICKLLFTKVHLNFFPFKNKVSLNTFSTIKWYR